MKTYQKIMQDEVNLPWTLLENSVFGAWILLEYSLNFISTNQHELCSLLGLCSFKDGDYLSEFVRAEQK